MKSVRENFFLSILSKSLVRGERDLRRWGSLKDDGYQKIKCEEKKLPIFVSARQHVHPREVQSSMRFPSHSFSKMFFFTIFFSLFFNVIRSKKRKMKRNIILSKFISFFYSHCVSFTLSPFNFPFIMALKHTYMLRYLCLCIATSLYFFLSLLLSFFIPFYSSSYYFQRTFLFLAHFS